MVSALLQALTTVAAVTSLVCCALVFALSWAFPPSLFGGRTANFSLRLLLYWTVAESFAAVSNLLFAVNADTARDRADGSEEVTLLCQVQGGAMQAGYLFALAWAAIVVFHEWTNTVLGERHGRKWEALYVLLAIGAPLADVLVVAELGYLGPTDLWCWISARHQQAQWLHWYIPQLAVMAAMLLAHVSSVRAIRARAKRTHFGGGGSGGYGGSFSHSRSSLTLRRSLTDQQHQSQSETAEGSVPIMSGGVSSLGAPAALVGATSRGSRPAGVGSSSPFTRARTHLFLFILLRTPALIHRAWEYFHTAEAIAIANGATPSPGVFILEVLHALGSPLQGTIPLVMLLQSPRMGTVLAQRWDKFLGNAESNEGAEAYAARSERDSIVDGGPGGAGGSGGVGAGSGYRSLTEGGEYESASTGGRVAAPGSAYARLANAQSVFPPAVWRGLVGGAAAALGARKAANAAAAVVEAIVPPTCFQSFPPSSLHAAAAAAAAEAQAHEQVSSPFASGSSTAAWLGPGPGEVSAPPPPPPPPPAPRPFKVFAGTWNMANEPPPIDAPSYPRSYAEEEEANCTLPTDSSHSLGQWIPAGANASQFDLIVLGVQECIYDTKLGRGKAERACLPLALGGVGGWNDRRHGVASTEAHWVATVLAVVNRGRDGIVPPLAPRRSSSAASSSSSWPSSSPALPGDLRPFELVSAVSMGHIRLVILAHPALYPLLHSVRVAREGSGLANIHINKGGVGVAFRARLGADPWASASSLGLGLSLGAPAGPTEVERSFAFVNVHLAALDGFLDDRNEDVVQILSRLALLAPVASTGNKVPTPATEGRCPCLAEQDPTQSFDLALFLGDLNYRLALPPSPQALDALGGGIRARKGASLSKAERKRLQQDRARQTAAALERGDRATLVAHDELAKLMRRRRLFVGWHEAPIAFFPTYKYTLAPSRSAPLPGARPPAGRVTYSGNPAVAAAEKSAARWEESQAREESRARTSSASALFVPSATAAAAAAPAARSSISLPSHDPSLYDAKRTPAYCDRILYSSSVPGHCVRVEEYRDVLSVASSDHKPVRAVLAVDFAASAASGACAYAYAHGQRHGTGAPAQLPAAVATLTPASPMDGETEGAAARPGRVAAAGPSSLSPPRRRKRTDSDTASSSTGGSAAESTESSASAQSAVMTGGVVSPASVRLLAGPSTSAFHSGGFGGGSSTRWRIDFSALAVFDTLDLYGLPIVSPYISFVSEALCGRGGIGIGAGVGVGVGAASGGAEGLQAQGDCERYLTTIATPLAQSGSSLQSLARSLLAASATNFSLFQSSPTALQAQCIRCVEWDARPLQTSGRTAGAMAATDDEEQVRYGLGRESVSVSENEYDREIPLLVTPLPMSSAQVAAATVQLVLRDAHHLGSEGDTVGVAVVPLAAGMAVAVGGSHEPVFFLAPLLAQSRYMGFISGYLSVQPIAENNADERNV